MKRILCFLGFHKWIIYSMVNRKGLLVCFRRECEVCENEQELRRPEKYHPTAYVWREPETFANINSIPNPKKK